VLEGANITFTTPGTWAAKASAAAMMGGADGAGALPTLPSSTVALVATTMHLDHRYHDDEGIAGADFEITFADGSKKTGKLDGQGRATVSDAPSPVGEVVFGPSAKPYRRKDTAPMPGHDPAPSAAKLAALVDRYAAHLLKADRT
jgi:hypothetical protein